MTGKISKNQIENKKNQSNLSRSQQQHIEKHVERHVEIALTWKDLIVHIVTSLTSPLTLEAHPYIIDLYTTLIVSFIAIIGIILVTKWVKKPQILVSESRVSKK